MTTFNTLVSAVKAIASPATVKAPAASKAEAASQAKMAADSLKLGKRPAQDDGYAALQRAQIRIADALGDNGQAIAASKEKETAAGSFHDQIALQAGRGGLVRDGEKLLALARLTGRLAANSTASDVDRNALAAIVREATSGNLSTERLGALVVKGEDVVRNAGRKVPTDRGLANATQQLQARIGGVEAEIGHLEAQMTGDNSSENLQQIQLKLADLNQQRDLLIGFKGQADRLANRRNPSEADLASMKSLLNGATQMTSAPELRAFLTEAEFVARHAGGPAGDRGVHQATKALAVRVGEIESQIAQLVDAAQGDVTSEELQKIQIKVADLFRDKDTLLAIKGQADRLANGRDELDAGDRATLLHHLNDADTNTSPEVLYQILGDLQQIGR